MMWTATVEAKALKAALAQLVKVARKKVTIPVLECIQIIPHMGEVELVATDIDTWMRIRVLADTPIHPSYAGKLGLVSASKLNEIIKTRSKGSVTLEIPRYSYEEGAENKAVIAGVTLRTTDPLEYPSPVDAPRDAAGERQANDLPAALKAVKGAIIDSKNSPNLVGALVKSVGDFRLEVVGTDGHRLHVAHAVGETPEGFEDGFLIPRTAVDLIEKLGSTISWQARHDEPAEGSKEKVTSGWLFVRSEDGARRLEIRLDALRYPQYERCVVDKADCDVVVQFESEDLVEAIERIKPALHKKTQGAVFLIDPEKASGYHGGTLTLTAENYDGVSATAKIAVTVIKRPLDPIKIETNDAGVTTTKKLLEAKLNCSYVLDAMAAFCKGEAEMGFKDGPMVRISDVEFGDTVVIVMGQR